jgi:hypothetical protein
MPGLRAEEPSALAILRQTVGLVVETAVAVGEVGIFRQHVLIGLELQAEGL